MPLLSVSVKYAQVVTTIWSLGKTMPLCSCCAKKKLVCVVIALPIGCLFFVLSVQEQTCSYFAMLVLSLMLSVCFAFFIVVCIFPILAIKTYNSA